MHMFVERMAAGNKALGMLLWFALEFGAGKQVAVAVGMMWQVHRWLGPSSTHRRTYRTCPSCLQGLVELTDRLSIQKAIAMRVRAAWVPFLVCNFCAKEQEGSTQGCEALVWLRWCLLAPAG